MYVCSLPILGDPGAVSRVGRKAVDGKETYKKNVMHVQSCCSALSSYCLFDLLVAAAS